MPNLQINELVERYQALPTDRQEQVLALLRDLDRTLSQGVPGTTLLKFAGSIPADELDDMSAAIEQGCEQVDRNEW
ncbi:MAG: hypothetical protein KIT77_20750 [Caldilinea sp.]|nr:hypothetical protein [Caldilinea sp.]MCW5843691.1 hypothetical protein [Caldilinea sp.]